MYNKRPSGALIFEINVYNTKAQNLESGKLNRPDHIASLLYLDLVQYGVVGFNIDYMDYIIPLSGITSGNGNPCRLNMVINPNSSKRSLCINWYADGNTYTSYIDTDNTDI